MSTGNAKSSTISSKSEKFVIAKDPADREERDGKDDENQEPVVVTTHLLLKPTNTAGSLDRDTVLRRIRNRKRVNRLKNAVRSFFGSPVSGKPEKVLVREKSWIDDAFSAP